MHITLTKRLLFKIGEQPFWAMFSSHKVSYQGSNIKVSLLRYPILWISDTVRVTQLTHMATVLLWTKVVWLTGDLSETLYLTNFLWRHCQATYHVMYECLVRNWLHKCLFYTWNYCYKINKNKTLQNWFILSQRTTNSKSSTLQSQMYWLRRCLKDQLVSRLNHVVYTHSVSYLWWYLAWA